MNIQNSIVRHSVYPLQLPYLAVRVPLYRHNETHPKHFPYSYYTASAVAALATFTLRPLFSEVDSFLLPWRGYSEVIRDKPSCITRHEQMFLHCVMHFEDRMLRERAGSPREALLSGRSRVRHVTEFNSWMAAICALNDRTVAHISVDFVIRCRHVLYCLLKHALPPFLLRTSRSIIYDHTLCHFNLCKYAVRKASLNEKD